MFEFNKDNHNYMLKTMFKVTEKTEEYDGNVLTLQLDYVENPQYSVHIYAIRGNDSENYLLSMDTYFDHPEDGASVILAETMENVPENMLETMAFRMMLYATGAIVTYIR